MSRDDLSRLKAPIGQGDRLVHPPLDRIAAMLTSAADPLADVLILGRPLADIRELARHETIQAAAAYLDAAGEPIPHLDSTRWIVGGHQPELFHPGVWFKNFLLGSLARKHGALALNLIIDSDLVKSSTLRLPAGDRTELVPFDVPASKMPYEERDVLDEAVFHTVPERADTITRTWPFRPWLGEVWNEAIRVASHTQNLGERIVRTRRRLERTMGLTPVEIPWSAICRTEAFAWFACAVLAELPGFVRHYNAAVHQYRERHGLRSVNHPAPELVVRADAIETPFWVWLAGKPQRRRLFAARDGRGLSLITDNTELARFDGPPEAWLEAWPRLEELGVKVRTRALATTLFARLFLADVFVHGIGGGKYDEVTDAILATHFRVVPPPYMVATATLRLPFPVHAIEDVRALAAQERDLFYNPQRHVEASPLTAAKSAAMALPTGSHVERVERFRTLLKATADLRPLVAERIEEIRSRRELAAVAERRRLIESSREYSFCLFPEEQLRSFFRDV